MSMLRYARRCVALALLVSCIAVAPISSARAEGPVQQRQMAAGALEQLKTDAFTALRKGEYDRTTQLLKQAATASSDPTLELMASWVGTFTSQYEKTLAGRKAEFDKATAQFRLLSQMVKPDYALDATARAYSLTIDKRAFRNEPWVDAVIKQRAAAAEEYEKSGEWHKASRIYIALSVLEPANPVWKNQLKLAARYVRIAALYTPNQFKKLQKEKEADDEVVEKALTAAGLRSGSTATTKPTTKPAEDEADAQLDWRDILKDIDAESVPEAIRDAVRNYWREVNYRQVTTGGLEALRTLVTTPGLQTAFPTLDNAAKRDQFVKSVDKALLAVTRADADDYIAFRDAFSAVRTANQKTVSLPENVFVYEFMDGAFSELDPFSGMIWPQQLEEFKSSTEGEFSGVGVQIERDESGALKVVTPIEDTPAYRAGIKAGDSITHVNGEYVKGILLEQAVRKIKGPTGSKVTLTVRSPEGSSKDYTLKRDTIKVASIKGWKHMPGGGWNWTVDPVQRVGYVRLTNFSKTTSDDLEKALQQMQEQGIRGVIMDLRANPGGLLTSAVEIADMFVPKGVIVSTKADRTTAQSPSVNSADPSAHKYNFPMVVLVNQLSASASEIVSGALKDHHRAIVVGERSYGKGSVQMLFQPARNAVLKLTTSHYYLPSGRCLHREENSTEWGVDPDFRIEMTPEQARAAMEARMEMDVLRGLNDPDRPLKPEARKSDLLEVDPQLSAAVMLMRLQIAGIKLQS